MENTKNLQSRISRFRRLHEQTPGARYFAPLADLLRQDGRYDEALDLLENGLETHTGYKAGLVIRGRTLQEVGRQDEALEVWSEVHFLDKENALALEALALGALDKRDWGRAVPLLEELCRLSEEESSWSELLLEARGYLDQSTQNKALEVDPENSNSFDTMTLVDIYLTQGYRDRALDVLRRMLPGSGDGRDKIQDRIQRLESGEEVVEEVVGNVCPASDPEALQSAPSADTAGRPLSSESERLDREKERTERRAVEQRQFEEWLEKIRFNGGHGN